MKKLSIFIIIATVVLSGCSKSYYDINQNPNQSTNASVDLVLANALNTTAGFQVNQFQAVSEWLGYWAPSGSYAINSSDGASYKQTTGFADGLWIAYYRNLEDYDYVQKTATANNQYFYIAAAKTMKAYVYGQLVDMFNNVPYSEALQGTTIIQPKYDDAKAIYESLSTNLDDAVKLFQRADAVAVASQDILFAGNTAQWAKFANTLRLRLLIHQAQMSGRSAYIAAEIAKIQTNGSGYLTTDAGVNPGYSNSTGKQNPLWALCYNTAGTFIQDFWRANKYPITWGQANGDIRYQYLYAPVGGVWVGNVIGATNNAVGSASSTFGSGVLKSVAQPAIILSASESYFLQAEAGLRGWIANSPAALVNSGVQANFSFLGAGSAAAYTSQNNKQTNYTVCTNDAERLACIIRQKWMANNFTTPLEAWNDYRRTGLPADLPITVHPNADVYAIPTRFLYAASEYQTNASNVNAMGSINHHGSKIFWMP